MKGVKCLESLITGFLMGHEKSRPAGQLFHVPIFDFQIRYPLCLLTAILPFHLCIFLIHISASSLIRSVMSHI